MSEQSVTNRFLTKFKNQFGSSDGYPGEFDRETLFKHIKVGTTVGILTPHGNVIQGRAVMFNRGQNCWVLNAGGAHGTPKIAEARNTVFVTGAAKILKYEKR